MALLTLEGTIEDIIFRNDENSYTVAKMECEGESLTVVGYLPFVNVDETVKVEGEFTYHNSYGEQFKVENISIVVPSTKKGIERYLSSGMIPYIGPKTAKKIVERFGVDTLDIIQMNPQKLLEIEGIGDKKLEKITEAFQEQGEIRNILIFLQQYGITANYSMKIYNRYGNDTVGIIKENPYRLSEDIYGIGFKTADKIAQNMGIEINSPYRIKGGINYILNRSMGEGHIYLPKEELLRRSEELLNIDKELVEENLMNLAFDRVVYMIRYEDKEIVYNTRLYQAESYVSKKIVQLSLGEVSDFDLDVKKEIEDLEKEDNIRFGEKQKVAIEESTKNGFLVITGGPGTGKTTTINTIINIFENEGREVTLAAPTGRAAKRMTETTGKEAKTIHRLLEYSYMEEESMAFGIDEDNPLETDLLIIDEASMIDILLMNSLLKAVSSGTKVILVGDVDQLPSVGAGNVLKDIIDSKAVEVVVLDEIFRQAEESMIVVNAHRINNGQGPFLNLEGKDFFFLKEKDPIKIRDTIKELCKERLPSFYGVDSLRDIQVLTPMRKGDVGVIQLNKSLQKTLNRPNVLKKEKSYADEVFRVGDKVMQIKNNYSVEWEIRNSGVLIDKGEGIFNGDIGVILDVDHESSSMRILFDDEKEVDYEFNQLDELNLAYATTVHKSQGSEFPVVVMPLYWGPPMLLTRNLLYTAITRAKSLVVLVGDERYMYSMIRNNKIAERYSTLDHRINEILFTYKYK